MSRANTRGLARCLFPFLLLITASVMAEAPPAVDLSLVTETDRLEPKEELILYILVANKSGAELSHLSLDTLPGRFEVAGKIGLVRSLAPFASMDALGHLAIRAGERVPFGKYQVPFILHYHWKALLHTEEAGRPAPAQVGLSAAIEGDSTQRAYLVVEVQAPYSAIASGLPGGTGPLFWLLLPVIPAFLAFQFVQGLRRKQSPHIPTFSTDNLLPAFFIAIVINSLPFWSTTLAELSTGSLLAGSAVLGALWPLCLWSHEEIQWRRWGFRDQDDPPTYLRKALLSRWVQRPTVWVTGTAGKAKRSGLLLQQPRGGLALGSRLMVSPVRFSERTRIETLVKRANQGARRDRLRLFKEAGRKQITLKALQRPTLGEAVCEDLAITGPLLEGFELESAEREPLLVYSQ
jgi:hypothetical protein